MKLTRAKRCVIRIVVAAVLFVALFVLYHFCGLRKEVALPLFAAVYLFIGYEVAWSAIRGLLKGMVTDENLLMFVATVGAFVIGEYPEAIAVMLFYQVGEAFQRSAVGKARRSIAELMAVCPDTATVIRNGEELTVSPDEIAAGELILIKPGERVAIDGVVISGQSSLNSAALTGESKPYEVVVGDKVMSGSVNLTGTITLKTECAYEQSTVARILELVENASAKKAKTESFISRFAAVYTPIVMIAAVLLALIPSLITGQWSVWGYRALTFLVVSCPCALVISIPLSFFGSIGGASTKGILIKGGSCMEALASVNTVLFDKTGTLTRGVFAVKEVFPSDKRDELIRTAAIAESHSLHPIARSICDAAGKIDAEGWNNTEIAGRGVVAENGDKILIVGSKALLAENGIVCPNYDGVDTAVFVAENGACVGFIVVGDILKDGAYEAIRELKSSGMKAIMLSGDTKEVAARVSDELGLDGYAAELLPQDKVAACEKYLGAKSKVAFVGDGINDAPVLMRADVGIAMGGIGSDSAIEAADIVLVKDDLGAILKAVKIARKTMRIVKENIAAAIGVKAAVLLLSALGLVGMWAAIIADVGVMVLAVLNSLRTLKR